MELLLIFFLAVAIFAVASLAFCWWLLTTIVRGVWRAIAPPRRPVSMSASQPCANADCRCPNPTHARFCRRCGQSLPALLRAIASQAAML